MRSVALPLRRSGFSDCRFVSCSVLPVRSACNLRCPFCFSKSSISALEHDAVDLRRLDLAGYYAYARERGATRLVVTGGGEPLLRPEIVLYLVREGKRHFDEVTCFTNGSLLSRELSEKLADAGLSYLCWSRHAADDAENQRLMGRGAPGLDAFFRASAPLKVRATCVMAKGSVDDASKAWAYVRQLSAFGVREFTFKHTYVAHHRSLFARSDEDEWARAHQIDDDPFEGQGDVVGSLPWGPQIRRIEDHQICFYREPTPDWELQNRLCRSTNLLSNGEVYASLEDRQSLLYRLSACSPQ